MATLDILVLEGDGIGGDVTRQAVAMLELVGKRAGIDFNLEYAPFGGASIDAFGEPVTEATLEKARTSQAVLLGAVGGPKWDELPTAERPEKGLLRLRESLELFANLRPARLFPSLSESCPLRPERAKVLDFVVVRELVGGIYFGEPRGQAVERRGDTFVRHGFNTMAYDETQIRRIGRVAFEVARNRKHRVASVDKANVLEVQALWRDVISQLGREAYPDVALTHLYVDNCAMQLVLNPGQFDVLVTGNMFGDILSDTAAALTGSIGLLPSASLGDRHALYEPVHGSAPDIAGTGRANPLAAMRSAGMLLEHTARRPRLARAVEEAVEATLAEGLRTPDLIPGGRRQHGLKRVGTSEMGAAVRRYLAESL